MLGVSRRRYSSNLNHIRSLSWPPSFGRAPKPPQILFPEDKLYGSYKRRNPNWDKEVIKMHPTARANGEKTRGYLFCNLWQTYILEVRAYESAVVCLPASDHMHLEFLGSVLSRPRLCSLSRVHWVSDFGFKCLPVSLCWGRRLVAGHGARSSLCQGRSRVQSY